MKDNNYKYDCIISCKDGEINCHKILLILNSDYFNLYYNNIENDNFADLENMINIDYDKKHFQFIINLLYNIQNIDYYTESDFKQILKLCNNYLFSDNIINKVKIKYDLFNKKYEKVFFDIDEINFIKYIDTYDLWTPSYYCKIGKKKYNNKVRSSLTYYSPNLQISNNMINTIFTSDDFKFRKFDSYDLRYSKILKYVVGSHFKEHLDKPHEYIVNNEIFHSCGKILFIWFSEDAIGGNLILDGKKVISKEDGVKKWLYFFMPLYQKHEVTKLIQGTRYTISIPTFKINEYDEYDDYDYYDEQYNNDYNEYYEYYDEYYEDDS